MILNRPSNLWLGAATAIFNVFALLAHELGIHLSAELVIAVNAAFGAIIALVAVQPPTINANERVHVKTGNGSPDKTVTFNEQGQVATSVNKE